jgi:hypothetical protein
MPLRTMNVAGADKAFRPWDTTRPPGFTAQAMGVESQPAPPISDMLQSCPICGRRLRILVEHLGQHVRCRHCRGTFVARDAS